MTEDKTEHVKASESELVPIEPADELSFAENKKQKNLTFLLAQSALLSGLTRFVPIPLLDDFLQKNVLRFMIAMLLKKEERHYPTSHVAPLYAGATGLWEGCLGWFIMLPITVTLKLLKKLFKGVFIFLLIREAGLVIGETLLLGHCLHRALTHGAFQKREDDPIARSLLDEAVLFRRAFDEAFAGCDRRLLSQMLSTVFVKVGSLPRLGARAVRAMFNRRALSQDRPLEMPESSRAVMEKGVEELQKTMEKDDVRGFLREFEEIFDRALRNQQTQYTALASDIPKNH